MTKKNSSTLTHLAIAALGGAAISTALSTEANRQKLLSRAERDDPDFAKEVLEEISEVLDQWQPSENCLTEDDFTQDLFDYLEEETDFQMEIYPATRFGKPDILIADILVLELKISPNKAERDRLVGQCAGYSREWATWAVVIDGKPSAIGELQRLLKDKNLAKISVWNFS